MCTSIYSFLSLSFFFFSPFPPHPPPSLLLTSKDAKTWEKGEIVDRRSTKHPTLSSMASSNTYLSRPSYCFLPNDHAISLNPHDMFKLDEFDLYNLVRSNLPKIRKPNNTATQSHWKTSKCSDSNDQGANEVLLSLRVNIPDWSRILGSRYRENNRYRDEFGDFNDDDDHDQEVCNGEARVVPPHEFLECTRIASFFVHEGRGRTLKGRDLNRVKMINK